MWTINVYLVVLFQYVVDGLEEDVVDYGTVGTGENRTKLLKIYNSNPVEVQLKTLLEYIHQITETVYIPNMFNLGKKSLSTQLSNGCLCIPQVTIYRIVCNLQFTKIRLLEIRSNNESKQSKRNHNQSSTTDQPLNSQDEDGKVRIVQNKFVGFGWVQRNQIFWACPPEHVVLNYDVLTCRKQH